VVVVVAFVVATATADDADDADDAAGEFNRRDGGSGASSPESFRPSPASSAVVVDVPPDGLGDVRSKQASALEPQSIVVVAIDEYDDPKASLSSAETNDNFLFRSKK